MYVMEPVSIGWVVAVVRERVRRLGASIRIGAGTMRRGERCAGVPAIPGKFFRPAETTPRSAAYNDPDRSAGSNGVSAWTRYVHSSHSWGGNGCC